MRLISFNLTQQAVLERRKTVTRRLGWKQLKAGAVLKGVHKCQGIKPGEHPRVMAKVVVTDVRRERLDAIDDADVRREGFEGMSAEEFVSMFCLHMKCEPSTFVTRIEFEYL